ncbi:MAG: redoxin domain-containing protein [Chloroflexi bacterium]|nr:redoxin domain-containing protein [Chloroflexota bacterium]
MTTNIVYNDKATTLSRTEPGQDIWLTLPDLATATGWELKPEGVCREGICIPLPADQSPFILGERGQRRFNLSAFARLIEQPFVSEEGLDTWYFGPAGWQWKERLASQQAPNFTLPDFEGKTHSLADYRGRKVFLLAWASW